jgi:FKBP-type peptidyl-prolyl cis-trans isomerase FkpA
MTRKNISGAALGVALLVPTLAAGARPSQPAAPPVGAVTDSTTSSTTVPVEAGPQPQSDEQKTLYALGIALAQNLDRLTLQESELAYVVAGLEDGVLARQPQVDLEVYAPKLQALAEQRLAATAEHEAAASRQFLERMAAEPGAVRSESGIVVLSRKQGSGPRPTGTDTVRVNYHGTLPDGTVFDSSLERGQPVSFSLDEVIPCWTEAVQTMQVGGRLRVVCPPDLAYGDEGGPGIPAGSPLVFDIHLLGFGETSNSPSRDDDERDPLEQQVAALLPS